MHRRPTSPRKAKGVIAKLREAMFAADATCYYCHCQVVLSSDGNLSRNTATLDHKTPKSKGGHKTSRRNVVLCCLGCNQDKGDRTEEEFRLILRGE